VLYNRVVCVRFAGDYVCQIGDEQPKDQVHTLEILVPSTVRAVPDHGVISVRQGGTATLECKASGNPTPRIYWYRKVRGESLMPLFKHLIKRRARALKNMK
jgi:hypothetical protein